MTAPTWTAIHEAAMTQMLEILQTGQTVTADGRTLTHADLGKVQDAIDYAGAQIAKQSRSGLARIISVIPRA